MKKLLLTLAVLAATTLGISQQLIQDFESGTFPPVGWSETHTGVDALDQTTSESNTGTYSALFDDEDFVDTSKLFTPIITGLNTGSQLTFWERQNFGTYYEYHAVWISVNGGTFTELIDLGAGIEDTWVEKTVSLAAYAGNNIQLAFYYFGDFADEWYLDDIKVDLIPTCPDPSALSTTIINYDSVHISWTENAGATSWYVEYGIAPLTQGTGTKILTNNPDTLIGLTPDASYQYYVKSICGAGDSSNWVGPYSFTTPPTCPDPSSLSATVISDDSVSITWTENAGATSWYVEYGLSPLTQGTGTKILTNRPDTLTGLTANTTYQYYVKSICGAGDSSEWVGPYSFTTDCPDFFTPPFMEDFNSYSLFGPTPDCWQEAEGVLEAISTLSYGSSGWGYDNFGDVGSVSARVNIYNDLQYDWLLTPVIDLGNGSISYQAEFDISLTVYNDPASTILGADDTVAFVISTDGGVTWTSANILELWDASNNVLTNTGDHIVVDLTGYTGQVMFGFYGASSIDFSADDNDLYIDNFQVREIPSCPQPLALNATAITSNSASLEWTEAGAASIWHVEYDVTGFTIGTGANSIVNTPSNPFTAGTYSPSTTYDFYVRAICGVGDTSDWSGPYTFTTLCAPVPGDSLTDAILVSGLTYSNTTDNNCYTNKYVGRSGTDVVYKLALDSCIDSLVISTCGSDYDTYLYVLEDDMSTIVGSNDDSFTQCGSGGNSYLILTSADFNGGDTVYIVLDAFNSSEFGNATIDIEQKLRTSTDATFSYATNVCSGDSAMPTITGVTGGVFTAEAGLTVNPTTGKVYTNMAGSYKVYYTVGASACSSKDSATIIVDSIDYTLTLSNDSVYAVAGATSYQWIACDGGDTAITGETNSYYKATVSGNYAVIITSGACSDTSSCVLVASTNINKLTDVNFNMYPNPNDGEFNIITNVNDGFLNIEVINTVGQVVYTNKIVSNTTSINLNGVARGSYVVRLYNDKVSTQKMLIVR